MDHSAHNKIVSFIWSIADDCLRDVYVRGKYRDVILPMFVLRRLDCLLEPTKDALLEEISFQRDDAGLTDLDPEGLKEATGYVFYNTSPWTLKKLVETAANNRQILEANFKAYLDGFSDNVKEIVDKFKLRSQISHMSEKDVLLGVLEKFTSPYINLTPNETKDPDGRKLPELSNLGMGYVFEELIRKFNEENNEEAGEHFTPREVIDLMTHILFEPVKDQLPPVITVYDPACGSGGMLTEAQNFIVNPEGQIRATADIYLFGKEINDETYALCKSDMMIKGNNPENIRCGSTLAEDEFAGLKFDFMLSNPLYGKSWAGDQNTFLMASRCWIGDLKCRSRIFEALKKLFQLLQDPLMVSFFFLWRWSPTTREDFWRAKFEANVERDKKNVSDLEADGWRVMTVWECELKKAAENDLFEKAKAFLTQKNGSYDIVSISPSRANKTLRGNNQTSDMVSDDGSVTYKGKTYQLYRRYAGKAVTFIEENGELKFSIEGRVLSKSYRM